MELTVDEGRLRGNLRAAVSATFSRAFPRNLAAVYRVLGGFAAVTVTTYFAFALHLNLAAAGFIYLFIVLVVALRVGFVPATLTSLAANVCLNYFFVPPVLTFTINDPQNWVALAVFECSALLVSRLSDTAQEQTRRARNHEHELEALYEVSRELLLLNRIDHSGLQILTSLKRVFALEAVTLFDAQTASLQTIGATTPALEAATKSAYLLHRDEHNPATGVWTRVLQVGGCATGAIGFCKSTLTTPVVSALASLTAITLERGRLFDRHSQAEAEKQAEQLRTTVLDALAHEYKTPLTVVRTVTSGLLEMGTLSPPQAELVSLLDVEAIRLSEITTRLLQMSRLDRADIHIRRDTISLDHLIEKVLAVAKRIPTSHCIVVENQAVQSSIQGDVELLTIAITQYLDNAAKYSDEGSPITLSAHVASGEAHFSVHNLGPEIRAEDQARIFQRFYRASSSSYRAPGTGLGLWITKRIAAMHGGRVRVASGEGKGTTFFLTLPLNGKAND